MRQIKFRTWDKKNRKMYEERDLIMTPSGQVWVDAINEYKDGKFDKATRNLEWGYDVSIELMQFTGLLDKNGKEIYEGDVVSYIYGKNAIGVVTFEGYQWKIKIGKDKWISDPWSDAINHEGETVEVIGNQWQIN